MSPWVTRPRQGEAVLAPGRPAHQGPRGRGARGAAAAV